MNKFRRRTAAAVLGIALGLGVLVVAVPRSLADSTITSARETAILTP